MIRHTLDTDDVVAYWRVTIIDDLGGSFNFATADDARASAQNLSTIGTHGRVTIMRPVFHGGFTGLSFECYYNGRLV